MGRPHDTETISTRTMLDAAEVVPRHIRTSAPRTAVPVRNQFAPTTSSDLLQVPEEDDRNH